jgi:transposase-like protein
VITFTLSCPRSQSPRLVRNGRAPHGRQRYLCRGCGRGSRHDPRPNGYSEAERELILRAYQERARRRGLTRPFGLWRHTVTSWLPKK